MNPEHLEKLSKVMRYAGLNLTPQVLQIILDINVRELVDTLDSRLQENPNLTMDDIDAIVAAIQETAQKQAEAEALAQAKADNKAGKKPALAKA